MPPRQVCAAEAPAARCQDDPKDLRLELFVDADFGGDQQDVKSTSGGWGTEATLGSVLLRP